MTFSLVALLLSQSLDAGVVATPPPPPPMVEADVPATLSVDPPPPPPVDPNAVPRPATTTAAPMARIEEVFVDTRDGQHLRGYLEGRSPNGDLTLHLKNGGRLELPAASIQSVTPVTAANTEDRFLDPNRTRYLYGPSAMMLRQGEMSFSQTELVLSTFSYGVTNWFTVQVGSAVPVWFVPPLPSGFNFILAVKFGTPITERFSVAGGVQSLILPGFAIAPSGVGVIGAGLGFGSVTYGTNDAHVTFSLGVPFAFALGGGGGSGAVGPIFSLSGNLRVSRLVALVSENWLLYVVPTGSLQASAGGFGSLAARIMGEQIAVDLGFLVLGAAPGGLVPFPVPWVQFTYNFGNVLKR